MTRRFGISADGIPPSACIFIYDGREALGNLLLFLPMGSLLSLLWLRLKRRALLVGCCISFVVEALQMPTGRSIDLRDFIMNTFGVLAGMLLFLLFRAIFPRAVRAVSDGTD